MSTLPVLVLLLLDVVILIGFTFFPERRVQQKEHAFLMLLFCFSGMPALIYQIVWQRALFAIYGVNAQSVAVIVAAFMLGLGIGSFLGGRLSARLPDRAILIFGLVELGIALFGLVSLHIFRWAAAYSAGASLPATVFFTLLLLFIPTVLMGATLPVLVEHLVLRSNQVGNSVSSLYFANTFGSAVACYLCATFLLRNVGQSGAVSIAVCLNAAVGATAYLYARKVKRMPAGKIVVTPIEMSGPPLISLPSAAALAGLSGFVALAFEIVWFRVFSLASSDRAPAFALLLATYLGGIAAGCIASEKVTANCQPATRLLVIGILLMLAGVLSVYLPPFVAALMARNMPFLASAPGFFATAALIGSVFPLVCQLSISPGRNAGQGVSLIYLSNIGGSVLGSLGVGFVMMHYVGLRQLAYTIGFMAVLLGAYVLNLGRIQLSFRSAWTVMPAVASLIAIVASFGFYSLLFEKLIFGKRPEAKVPFERVVENRNGVIGVTRQGAVFGGGVYDGYFNVDPTNDINLVARVYALSAFCPAPKRILVIGLASGSWGQILANHPQVERLDAVEINPGYLQLIASHPVVASFVRSPIVHIFVDDGRRWLLAHPGERYDAIVANTTFNWRDHSSGLLSVEFLRLIRAHLNPRGVYYFNTTESDETIVTALHVFPYGLRVINFVAVGDSPIAIDKERWLENLRRYKIDGKPIFDPLNPAAQQVVMAYMALADTFNAPARFLGMESSDSLRARLGQHPIITDDNMGNEWQSGFAVPWR
jgi:spermidine synthase